MSHCSKTRNYKLVNQDEEARNPTIYIYVHGVSVLNTSFQNQEIRKGCIIKTFVRTE